MAHVNKQKIKVASGFGSPPGINDKTNNNLTQPNLVEKELTKKTTRATKTKLLDGRSLRKTGRTVQFNTKVTPEFNAKIKLIAQRDGFLLAEVLELAVECYEKNRGIDADL